jgi:hypothetical protein
VIERADRAARQNELASHQACRADTRPAVCGMSIELAVVRPQRT